MARIGFIGAGMVASWHVGCMRQLVPEAEIVGISDVDQQRAAAVAEEFGIGAFPSNEALLGAGVDAVFICVPPKVHKECVHEVLAAGKHIFCEKPLAATYEDGLEIAQAVERSDKKFQLGYLFHFSESARRVKSLLEDGALGDLALVWSQRFEPRVPPPGTWYSDPVGGGILDFCSHDIELLAWWGGKPLSVTSAGSTAREGLRCCDTTSITMRFETGIGTVLASWAAQRLLMNLGATGPNGTALLTHGGGAGLSVSFVATLEGQEEMRGDPEELPTVMAAEQRHFLANLDSDAVLSPGIREGLLALEIHRAIEQSWRTGERVVLS